MMITAILAVAFGLEWNPTYRTDVPYEVEVSPAKLGANAFKVFADGKELKTTTLEGVMPGTVDLRFRVPAGTKALTCEGSGDVRREGTPQVTWTMSFWGRWMPGARRSGSAPMG